MAQPEVLIIGFGAVGVLYGYVLSQAGCRVTAVCRSAFAGMNAQGIEIKSEKFGTIEHWKPHRLVASAGDANDRAYDFIICATKALPDLLPTSSILAEFLDSQYSKDTTVVLIQNGIGIETDLQTEYPKTHIISVVAWIGANLFMDKHPLVVHGMLEKLVMGLYIGEGHGLPSEIIDPAGYSLDAAGAARQIAGFAKVNHFAELLRSGGGEVDVVEDIQVQRFNKNLWNASLSTLCSISRVPVSELVAPSALLYTLPVVRRTMLEIIYIARAWGIGEDKLPASSVDNCINLTVKNYQVRSVTDTPASTPFPRSNPFEETPNTASFKPSMLLDVEAGRPCELEVIVGSLLDRARSKGVETPLLDLLYATLKVYQLAAVARAGSSLAHQEHIDRWNMKKSVVAGGGSNSAFDAALRRSDRKLKGAPVV